MINYLSLRALKEAKQAPTREEIASVAWSRRLGLDQRLPLNTCTRFLNFEMPRISWQFIANRAFDAVQV